MRTFIIVIFSALAVCGCAKKLGLNNSSNALIEEGRSDLEKGRYSRAAEAFEQAILNTYDPQEAATAQRLKADAYYLDKEYLDAIAAYETYNDLYDVRENDPTIIYRLAMSYYNMASKPGRDSSFTFSSISYFNRLRNEFPDFYDEMNASVNYAKMIDNAAESEYEVGRYYMRIKDYDSAISRFVYLINNYPESSIKEKAYENLIEASLNFDDKRALVLDYIDELKATNPENRKIKKFEAQVLKE